MHRVHALIHMEIWNISVSMEICLSLSHIQIFATPRTVAHQAPLSVGFSRQEYWGGLPLPLQGIFPTPELNPCLLLGGRFFTTEPSEKSMNCFEGRCNSPLNRNDGKSQKRKHWWKLGFRAMWYKKDLTAGSDDGGRGLSWVERKGRLESLKLA